MTKTSSVKGSESGYALPTTVGIINHDPTRHRAPGYSIKGRYQDRFRPSPGPQYNVNGGMSPRGTGYSPCYSITGRPKRSVWDSMSNSNPGPSSYNVQENRVSHSFSIGAPYQVSKRSSGPAPNAYQVPDSLGNNRLPTLRTAPATTLKGRGNENTGFSYDKSRTPGPAAYGRPDPYFTARRAPAITIKGRSKLPPIQPSPGPGPGAYDQGNYDRLCKTSPRFSIGIRHGDKVRPMYTLADVSD